MIIKSTEMPVNYYEETNLYSPKLVGYLHNESLKLLTSESSSTPTKKFTHLFQESATSEWIADFNSYKNEINMDIIIDISPEKTLTLPAKLYKLAESIKKSRYILDLEDDFDDEGSSGYEFETWKRAVDFLVNSAKWALEKNSAVIDNPNIYHGPDGSIDVLWKNADYRLLINFPKDNANPVTFYGDDCKANKIEGTFDLSKNDFGLLQLMLKTIY